MRIPVNDKTVIINEKYLTFNIENINNTGKIETFFLHPKTYVEFWKIENKCVVLATEKGYYIISPFHNSYFMYKNYISDISCNENDRINIKTNINTVLRVVLNPYDYNLLVEFYGFEDKFEEESTKETPYLISKYKYRYIPFIIDVE
jgi:hypothetical protein